MGPSKADQTKLLGDSDKVDSHRDGDPERLSFPLKLQSTNFLGPVVTRRGKLKRNWGSGGFSLCSGTEIHKRGAPCACPLELLVGEFGEVGRDRRGTLLRVDISSALGAVSGLRPFSGLVLRVRGRFLDFG